jgi:hypothetical protein
MQAIAKDYDLMLECMVNHISPASEQYQDFLEKGDASEHASMFIDWHKFWGEGAASFLALANHNIPLHRPPLSSGLAVLQGVASFACCDSIAALLRSSCVSCPTFPRAAHSQTGK